MQIHENFLFKILCTHSSVKRKKKKRRLKEILKLCTCIFDSFITYCTIVYFFFSRKSRSSLLIRLMSWNIAISVMHMHGCLSFTARWNAVQEQWLHKDIGSMSTVQNNAAWYFRESRVKAHIITECPSKPGEQSSLRKYWNAISKVMFSSKKAEFFISFHFTANLLEV